MGLANFFLGKRSRSGRRRPGPRPAREFLPRVEQLEPRHLPSATANLIGSTLTVQPGPTAEHVDVNLDPTLTSLVVRDYGVPIGIFPSASVGLISITGSPGNDIIRIGNKVTQPATINGGAGNDLLQGGGGPASITGGNGNNILTGATAPSLLTVGNGNNVLTGHSGQDTFQVGTGHNKLFTHGNDKLIGVGAKDQVLGSVSADPPANPNIDSPNIQLTQADVQLLLCRAAAATPSDDFIVAVVDRGGRILGVRVEGGVSTAITGSTAKLVFSIDGAVALARTGAFFANNGAPLTSRTIEEISQTTITQREVESMPDSADPTMQGPGFVAPVGTGGHFPPNVDFTPQVDLFEIEGTNRDRTPDIAPAGVGGKTGFRFNTNPAFTNAALSPPDSYGFVSGLEPTAHPRGIGTLPGGVPIFKNGVLVGGIGVFYPGTTGFADEENSTLSTTYDPSRGPDRSLEAEFIAFAAAGGSSKLGLGIGPIDGCPNPNHEFDEPVIPPNRIDLVGITLDVFGPGGRMGPTNLFETGLRLGFAKGNPVSGVDEPLMPGGMPCTPTPPPPPGAPPPAEFACLRSGVPVPTGFIVTPHAGVGGLTAADVTRIIFQGIATANNVRAAIRLPLNTPTAMVLAVADTNGDILGLYRMPDATIFSIDVAVAKSRNVAYYANPGKLQPIDQLPGVPNGVAFTNRTFRYLAEPRYPEGIDGMPPGPFSILNDGGADLVTALQVGPRQPVSSFQSVLGYDAFHPETNFRDPFNPQWQNGIVFFPGSVPLYKNGVLVGGFGVSGDGVDQDDVVTAGGATGYTVPPTILRADQIFFENVRLPYQKFNRNPFIHT